MYLTVYGNITGKTAAIRTNSSGGSKIYAQFYNGSSVSSVDGVAFVDEAGDANLFLSEQANLVGSILLGDGSDQLTLAGTDITALTILDGGDDVSAADGFIDTLTFTEGAFEVNGANLLNWEQVIVRNGTVSFLDNALTTGSEADIGLIAQNGGTILAGSAFTLDGNLDLRSGGSFVTQGNGSGSYMINYDLINAGHLNLSDENEGDLIEVAGNYVGSNGLITLDTRLHDDNSATDMISIAGNTSGNSDIKVYNTVGTGSPTTEGIKIVEVGGTSAGIFNLQGDYIHDGEQAVVGGAYAYKLSWNSPLIARTVSAT